MEKEERQFEACCIDDSQYSDCFTDWGNAARHPHRGSPLTGRCVIFIFIFLLESALFSIIS